MSGEGALPPKIEVPKLKFPLVAISENAINSRLEKVANSLRV